MLRREQIECQFLLYATLERESLMNIVDRYLQYLVLLGLSFLAACATAPVAEQANDLQRLAARAQNVTIVRDDFGIPHIYGKTDADAVFGLLYAQAEDDFPRVERNYIWAIGRLAEVDGEDAIYSDLRARL